MKKLIIIVSASLVLINLTLSCSEKKISYYSEDNNTYLVNDIIEVVVDNEFRLNISKISVDKKIGFIEKDGTTNYLVINGMEIKDFLLDESQTEFIGLKNNYGVGKRLILKGYAKGPKDSKIEKSLRIDMYDDFKNAVQVSVVYKNSSSTPGLIIEKEIDSKFTLNASLINKSYKNHDFWILQGGSYNTRPNWILPVTSDFTFENYQGTVYETGETGGGLPVLDVWCKETGFFIGSLRNKPTLISLPAKVNKKGSLEIGIEYQRDNISFDDTYETIPMVAGVHDGDYFNGLRTYTNIMEKNGFKMLEPTDDAYEAIWCGWGFGPDFTQQQMIEAIPTVKELGFKVVTVDAGWFLHNGDYFPREDTFPNGDEGMKNFVKIFHDNGLKIKLWIQTAIVGKELAKQHPEWLIRDRNNEIMTHSLLNIQSSPYICPAIPEVQEYYRDFVKKAIGEWGYDGFKVDQSPINGIAECYAEHHNHKSPAESFEALQEIDRIIYEETVKLKPNAILEVCPCGMFPSYYKMPYYNQPVSSDFNNPWQIRHRGKTIKALMGSRAAYYGDHVERHFSTNNYPSMIGVGGIPGTMFVLREEDNVEFLRVKYPCYLSTERRAYIDKWMNIYNEYYLSKGEYLNLYDIAYDKPEAHAIKKDGVMYYAFYAENWDGEIECRGLDEKTDYKIIDYVNNNEIGRIKGNEKIDVKFNDYLLVKAVAQ